MSCGTEQIIRWEGGGDTLKLAECSRYEEVFEEGQWEDLCVGSRVVFLNGQNRQKKSRSRTDVFVLSGSVGVGNALLLPPLFRSPAWFLIQQPLCHRTQLSPMFTPSHFLSPHMNCSSHPPLPQQPLVFYVPMHTDTYHRIQSNLPFVAFFRPSSLVSVVDAQVFISTPFSPPPFIYVATLSVFHLTVPKPGFVSLPVSFPLVLHPPASSFLFSLKR